MKTSKYENCRENIDHSSGEVDQFIGQHIPSVFCGVDALVHKLTELAMVSTDLHVNKVINEIATELYLLDAGLRRLKEDRSWVSVEDVNLFIDRLR